MICRLVKPPGYLGAANAKVAKDGQENLFADVNSSIGTAHALVLNGGRGSVAVGLDCDGLSAHGVAIGLRAHLLNIDGNNVFGHVVTCLVVATSSKSDGVIRHITREGVAGIGSCGRRSRSRSCSWSWSCNGSFFRRRCSGRCRGRVDGSLNRRRRRGGGNNDDRSRRRGRRHVDRSRRGGRRLCGNSGCRCRGRRGRQRALKELARNLLRNRWDGGGNRACASGRGTGSDPAGGSQVNVLGDDDCLPVGSVLDIDVTFMSVGTFLMGTGVSVMVVWLRDSQRGKAKGQDGAGLHFEVL